MDSSSNIYNLGQDDENLRVKFLCSFSGSVMPRPQDGKLRYVGGETRMVSVCRFIKYEELMEKMREIYESASILKYQQPDEDLDALVSVVNDDDVMNMMEENDKLLDFVDGFTRLRIFLFANPVMDSSPHLEIEANESGISRYVDALNNLPDSCDNNLIESQGNPDLLIQHQFNLRHLAVPRLDQRYSEVESVRSPIYCSPSHHHHDLHSDSPSSAIFRSKITDEYSHQQINPSRVSDNLVWFPPGDRSCFPLNLNNHGCNFMEGASRACENCRMNMQRSLVFSDEHLYFQQHHCFKNEGFQPCSSDNSPSNREISSDKSYMKGIGGPVNNEALFVEKSWKGGYNMMNFSNYNHYHHDFLHEQPAAGRPFSPLSNEEDNATFFNNFPHTCRVDATNQASYRSHMYPTGGGATSPRVIRGTPESSPMFCIGKDGQNVGFDGYMIPTEYSVDHRTNTPVFAHGSQRLVTTTDERETHCFIPSMPMVSSSTSPGFKADVIPLSIIDREGMDADACAHDKNLENVKKNYEMKSPNEKSMENDSESSSSTIPKHVDVYPLSSVGDFADSRGSLQHEVPESVKEMSLRDCEEQKIDVHEGVSSPLVVTREDVLMGVETVSGIEDKDVESGSEQSYMSKIEPTKAEEEALARGLQTIKNDDLEEIRELGSGTYGAVYHGKWRGSDVAVKRIKATCFSGKPSERERMITDFWKEASILSSLHHPNVVSFYGIVRDGPDGSLATVTEFMINGSLKQFLHKKDRTVDRRKRLIIGMDVAFGMEYLHAKNIVHFDLKCENLLVNMRDPQRPICKIGDLGLSKVKRNTLVSGGVRGTLPWMAPELLNGKTGMVTEKIDVYSFGIVMWELLTGEDPYAEMHCASIIGGIVKNELRPEIPTWCDPEWKCLMESCWDSDPSQRPSFSLISHKLRTMAASINLK